MSMKNNSQPPRPHSAESRAMSTSDSRPELIDPKATIPQTPRTTTTVPWIFC
jgi:hypothetical protein